MSIPRRAAGAVALAVAALLAPATPASAATTSVTARFVGGSGSYLTTPSGTDNLRQVSGSVTFSQSAPSALFSATGSLTGLQPSTWYVTVPYRDGACIPAAGVTAFPSTAFSTDASGAVSFTVTVNQKAINPTADFNIGDVNSVSIRQVVVQSTTVPDVVTVPNVPNVGAVETCDKNPS